MSRIIMLMIGTKLVVLQHDCEHLPSKMLSSMNAILEQKIVGIPRWQRIRDEKHTVKNVQARITIGI